MAWVIAQSNRMFTGKFIQESFGLRTGVAERAEPMLRALGLDPDEYRRNGQRLGAADLLVSTERAHIIERRDSALAGFDL